MPSRYESVAELSRALLALNAGARISVGQHTYVCKGQSLNLSRRLQVVQRRVAFERARIINPLDVGMFVLITVDGPHEMARAHQADWMINSITRGHDYFGQPHPIVYGGATFRPTIKGGPWSYRTSSGKRGTLRSVGYDGHAWSFSRWTVDPGKP